MDRLAIHMSDYVGQRSEKTTTMYCLVLQQALAADTCTCARHLRTGKAYQADASALIVSLAVLHLRRDRLAPICRASTRTIVGSSHVVS